LWCRHPVPANEGVLVVGGCFGGSVGGDEVVDGDDRRVVWRGRCVVPI